MCGSVLGIDLNISIHTHTYTSASVHTHLPDPPGLAPPRIGLCDGPMLVVRQSEVMDDLIRKRKNVELFIFLEISNPTVHHFWWTAHLALGYHMVQREKE